MTSVLEVELEIAAAAAEQLSRCRLRLFRSVIEISQRIYLKPKLVAV